MGWSFLWSQEAMLPQEEAIPQSSKTKLHAPGQSWAESPSTPHLSFLSFLLPTALLLCLEGPTRRSVISAGGLVGPWEGGIICLRDLKQKLTLNNDSCQGDGKQGASTRPEGVTEGPCLPRPETHGIQFKTERVEMGRETHERQDSVGADQGLSLPDPLILKLDPFKL